MLIFIGEVMQVVFYSTFCREYIHLKISKLELKIRKLFLGPNIITLKMK